VDPDRFEAHMSDSDALMWNVEKDPLLRSTIVTVLLLDRAPDWDALRERVERGSWLIPRLRQRVATPILRLGPPHWSADPNVDLDYHMRRLRAPDPSFDAVLELARTASMAGFDRARPLWEYTVVEGLADERAAMILKVHHSMTDGVGGMRLLLMLFDFEREPEDHVTLDRVFAVPSYSPTDLVVRSIGHNRRRLFGIVNRTARESVGLAHSLTQDPVGTLRAATTALSSIARYLAPATVPLSPTMRARSLARRLGRFDVPLDAMKRAAKAADGSLNDAFVASVVGGMARYHASLDAPADVLRMVMPINLRPDSAALGGNHFTPARFLVPLDIADPIERMHDLGRRARATRDEPAVALTDTLAGVLNLLPTTITTSVFGAMLKGSDFVTSNVPGSPIPLYAGGAQVEKMYAFAPLAGTAVNVTLLSHVETCCIGVNFDAMAVPDGDRLLNFLEDSFLEITTLA
jgi:diacylglycerol O-acyltransferase / wax synthase